MGYEAYKQGVGKQGFGARRSWLAGLVLTLGCTLTYAQDIPRTAAGKPDLQGIWKAQASAVNGLETAPANGDMQAVLALTGGAIPYQANAAAQRQVNFDNRLNDDPLNKCFIPGVPRIMSLDYPYQIFQNDREVAMTFQWTQMFRYIPISDTPSPYEGVESWMGRSRAHWEGDTLVVEVRDFNGNTWLDASGNFHGAALTVTERYDMTDAGTIHYQATITDPEVFTEPWTIAYDLERQTDQVRLMEFQCQAEKEEQNGDFERDVRTWYPAPIPADNAPFDASAGVSLPLPQATGAIRRLPDGTPDIEGYFNAEAGGANYGLESAEGRFLTPNSRGVVVDPEHGGLPYQAWARIEREERILPQRGYDDPTAHCFVAGLPRSHYVPSPFYIMQTRDFVLVLHERMSWRQISLVRTEHLPDDIRLWQGDSLGHWEGDTLVVDSSNFNGKTWLNESGDVISHMQKMRETFTPVDENRIIYRATINDPIAYTQPWTIEMPFDRSEDELLEVACLEDNGDLQHLKDVRDEYRAAQQQAN
ncbi:MAG: hypothetical protein LBE21_03655 [Pseudomonadales bacterium]|jgi:hypothetical protein|nr:hypothetical protein [Pseudomonadales bacterium]